MGIYTDAEIRFGLVIPEDADPEKVEAAIEGEDALEVISFGEYDWSDIPTFALALKEPKVRCGEYGVQTFDVEDIDIPNEREVEEVAKQIAASTFGGDWAADSHLILVWSRG